MFTKNIKDDIKSFFGKEIVFLNKNKDGFAFRPLLALQGIIVVFVFLYSAISVGNLLLSDRKDYRSLSISRFEAETRAIAGKTTEHIVLIKSSEISNNSYYLKLPKQAKNIKVEKVSNQQGLLALQEFGTVPSISNEYRKTLAQSEQKPFILTLLTRSIASLSDAIGDAMQDASSQDEVQTVNADNSVYVDLSDEAQEPAENQEPAESITDDQTGAQPEPEQTQEISDIIETTTPSDTSPNVIGDTQENVSPSDQPAAQSQESNDDKNEEYVKVTYQTPAPEIAEQKTDMGKLVTISAENEDPEQPITNVVAYTNIPEIYKVGQESKIKIKWKNQGDQQVQFNAYDTNGNGKLDYVEWTIPHLSEQTFEIIFISKAFRLDEDFQILEDIYEYVQAKDNNWVSLNSGEYIRVTFEEVLDNTKDVTIHAKPSQGGTSPTMEVYPVYTDDEGNKTQGGLIATFPPLFQENTYQIFLTGLSQPTSQFDLKIIGAGLDVDFIVDPTPASITDNFDDTSKIASLANITVANGIAALSDASVWSCGDNVIDGRDERIYTTVLIGTQCWMKENLNIGTRVAGAGNQGTDCSSASAIQKYCYDNNDANCDTYGGLYQWSQAMCGSTAAGAKGICPTGWHIPTDAELYTLENFLWDGTTGTCSSGRTDYGCSPAGDKLKASGLCQGRTPCATSGFDALLAGNRSTNGSFLNLGSYTNFWSSVESGANAWRRYLYLSEARVYRNANGKLAGFSVRCLKD